MIAALLFALAVPTMTCKGVTAKQFCCVAEGLAGREAHWQIFDHQEPDRADGATACFDAPREWKVIQVTVAEGETAWLIRAMVKTSGDKVVFAPFKGLTGVE